MRKSLNLDFVKEAHRFKKDLTQSNSFKMSDKGVGEGRFVQSDSVNRQLFET